MKFCVIAGRSAGGIEQEDGLRAGKLGTRTKGRVKSAKGNEGSSRIVFSYAQISLFRQLILYEIFPIE